MGKHTPGPWEVQFDDDAVRVVGAGGALVTEMPFNLPPLGLGTPDEAEASRGDGELMAAAPELLRALVVALHSMERGDERGSPARVGAIKQARAAIAKAEGRDE